MLRILHSRTNKTFRIIPKTITNIINALFIMALCYSTVGCATLQALEPTAIFISNIKDIL